MHGNPPKAVELDEPAWSDAEQAINPYQSATESDLCKVSFTSYSECVSKAKLLEASPGLECLIKEAPSDDKGARWILDVGDFKANGGEWLVGLDVYQYLISNKCPNIYLCVPDELDFDRIEGRLQVASKINIAGLRSVIKERIETHLLEVLAGGQTKHKFCDLYRAKMKIILKENSEKPELRKLLSEIVTSNQFLDRVVRPFGDDFVRRYYEDLGLELNRGGGGRELVRPETSSWTGSTTDTVVASEYCPSESEACVDSPEVVGEDEVKLPYR